MKLADYLLQTNRRIDFKLGIRNVLIQRGSLDLVVFPGRLPLVSCLMVTRGRLFPSRFAVECFQRQTYANRELVLVCDTPGTEIERHCRELNDPRIRIVYPDAPSSSLGELRNLSLRAAQGEWICQWDDDDLYHPQRLDLGMAICQSMQTDALFLSRWLLWSPLARKIGVSGAREWEGSMLARKDSIPAYPALARGEDTAVTQTMIAAGRVVLADAPWLYTYVQTGANTWSDNHFDAIWKAASFVETTENYEAAMLAAASTGPHQAYAHACASHHGAMLPVAG
ncbi:glycosyltransferase [Noviherbaspirillum cavernae]|nr:glycosyltransferase [Noviherbaspirillum cavernae]